MMRTGMRPASPFILRKLHTTRAQSWKNGGGITRELARGAGWRISVADAAIGGPFSIFPNQRRSSVVFEGAGLDLRSGGVHLALDPMHCARYDGGLPWYATLRNGATRVFNVMAVEGQARAEVRVNPALAAVPACAVCLALCVADIASCLPEHGTPLGMVRGDYILFSAAAGGVRFETPDADAAVLVAQLAPIP